MKVKALVIAEEKRSFTTRKGVEIQQILLTALDKSELAEDRFKNTFDVTLDSPVEEYKNSVVDKVVELALTDLSQIFGGRARFRGRLIDKMGKV